MPDTKKIIIGAAAFYISVASSVDADLTNWNTQVSPLLSVPTNGDLLQPEDPSYVGPQKWRNVGFTMEGVEVSYEPDFGDIEVDQLLDSAKIFKQGMRVTVNTTMAEASLENLLVVWGQSPDARSSTGSDATLVETLEMRGGSLYDEPVERSLAFVGPAPRTATSGKRQRVYNIKRALQTQTSAHSLRRSEATGLPVSFRCLPASAGSVSLYGKITDRAVTSA